MSALFPEDLFGILQCFLTASDTGVMLLDEHKNIRYLNETMVAWTDGSLKHGQSFYEWNPVQETIWLEILADKAIHGQEQRFHFETKMTSNAQSASYLARLCPVPYKENVTGICIIVNLLHDAARKVNSPKDTLFRNRFITDYSPVGIWQVNPSGYLDYLNPAMRRILGFTENQEFETFHFTQFLPAHEQEKALQRNIESPDFFEVEIHSLDHKVKKMLVHAAQVKNAFGEKISEVGTMMDITDLRAAEERVQQSEVYFSTLFQQASNPKVIARNLELVAYNKAFTTWASAQGSTTKVGLNLLSFIPRSEHQAFLTYFADIQDNGSVTAPYTLNADDGRITEITGYPLALKEEPAVVLELRDITEKDHALRLLQRSEEKFRTIFETSISGLFWSTPDGEISRANQYFYGILGYPPEQFHRRIHALHELVSEESQATLNHLFELLKKEGYCHPIEVKLRHNEGRLVPVLLSASILDQGTGEWVGFVIDISAIQEKNEELEHLNEELNTFLYMASHDLKGPLATIKGLVGLAEKELQGGALEYMQLIGRTTEKLNRSIHHLLTILTIKNQPTELIQIPFGGLLEEIASLLRHGYPDKTLHIHYHHAPTLCVAMEPELMRSALQNLIENALKYSLKPEVNVYIELYGTAGAETIVVQDDGQGIPEEHLPHIFNLFFRGSHRQTGSGMGLFIVKSALKRMGYAIKADNGRMGGARFILFKEEAIEKTA
jgi:PAS domain S-box-containing protein